MVGPLSAVSPGTRKPSGPVGTLASHYVFTEQQDLDKCYPRPAWVADRLRRYPQRPVGNSLRDPLPVPFTPDEVVAALQALPRAKRRVDRICSRVDPAHVHVALAVLAVLESRNGAWIDFVPGRREDPLVNVPGGPLRVDVHKLRCLLYKLPGKPLPFPSAQPSLILDQLWSRTLSQKPSNIMWTTDSGGFDRVWPCNEQPPGRFDALYNIADVRTTFTGAQVPPVPPPSWMPEPEPRPWTPGRDGVGSNGPPDPLPPEVLGLQLQDQTSPPEPFSFSLFELFQSHDIKGA